MKTAIFALCLLSFMNLTADNDYENKTFFQYSFVSDKCLASKSFNGSIFYGVDFTNSIASYCCFMFTRFKKGPNREKTIFDGADLSYSEFMYADCRNVSFKNTKLNGTWLLHGDYRGADFTGADLKDSIMFDCKISFNGKNRTRVRGANFKDVQGLTNKQKKYLRRAGALNVPDECNEEEEWSLFKAKIEKGLEALSPLYPLNKWVKNCGRGVRFSIKWLWGHAVNELRKATKKLATS